ncbi:hypothetical protein B0H13DRAFT_2341574 [Mycena leptocephala]|nr:hypothetical protein B0H13DRAFT_2341574 [Mycena leptocephala]
MVHILKDIGADILTLGPIDIDESDPPFDYDGVNLLATAVLTGLLNWFGKLDEEHYALQPWPRSGDLLPHAYAFATSSTFENILPTVYQEAQVIIAVRVQVIHNPPHTTLIIAPYSPHEGELLENDGVVDEHLLHLNSTYTQAAHMDIMASPDASYLVADGVQDLVDSAVRVPREGELLETDGTDDEHLLHLNSTYTQAAHMDIIASLKSDASHLVAAGVQELVDSAMDAFVLLEPWCLAEFSRGSHSIIRDMIARLKKQAHRYFDAIDMSINCGDQGIVFSEHAIDLCHALETKMPTTEILKFIKRMETDVSRAQKEVKKTWARFSDVRGQLTKASECIPRHLERDSQAAQRAAGAQERRPAWNFEHRSDGDTKTMFAVFEASHLISVLPRVRINLPVVIPAAAQNRKKHTVNYQALLELEDMEAKIALVIKSVNNFATWWQKMICDLEDIKAQAISKGDIHEIVAQIRQQLVCLGGPCRAYSSQIRKLQDFYPASYDAPRKLEIILQDSVAKFVRDMVYRQEGVLLFDKGEYAVMASAHALISRMRKPSLI